MKTLSASLKFGILILCSHLALSDLAFGEDSQMKMIDSKTADMNTEAQTTSNIVRSSDCSHMETYDISMGMCMPLPMAGMPMTMLMIHGNSFFTATTEGGPRGRDAISLPNMFMADLGTSVSARHYLNLDFMGTLEKWTTPDLGYPELLQIGEDKANGQAYLDAQHPHSSPIMGLTLSDTISFGSHRDYVKIFVAPRGEATDGPIAFMHRVTGMVNPDAPLGHHIGQDVGHITSSVIGESLKLRSTTYEFSTYHGGEPSPTKVDLPLGKIDSYSVRIIEEFSSKMTLMASYGYVTDPEPDSPEINFEKRYSASIYNEMSLFDDWDLDNALIYGSVHNYDHASTLNSFAEEFWVHSKRASQIWGRVEVLQRTASELQIQNSDDPFVGKWVSAVTLGYTYRVVQWDSAQLNIGGSVTNDILPDVYRAVYGSNPWTEKIFLQLSGMKMWSL